MTIYTQALLLIWTARSRITQVGFYDGRTPFGLAVAVQLQVMGSGKCVVVSLARFT